MVSCFDAAFFTFPQDFRECCLIILGCDLTCGADFILAQDSRDMMATSGTVGPYMDVLLDGMLSHAVENDESLTWENPSGKSIMAYAWVPPRTNR